MASVARSVAGRFGGAEYEIDLSKKNAAAFRKMITAVIEHALKQGDRAAGQRVPGQSVSAAVTSGPGEGPRALDANDGQKR